ncbi:hypothetical protein D3C76_990600 [compost metagenome]
MFIQPDGNREFICITRRILLAKNFFFKPRTAYLMVNIQCIEITIGRPQVPLIDFNKQIFRWVLQNFCPDRSITPVCQYARVHSRCRINQRAGVALHSVSLLLPTITAIQFRITVYSTQSTHGIAPMVRVEETCHRLCPHCRRTTTSSFISLTKSDNSKRPEFSESGTITHKKPLLHASRYIQR